ncbi:hypothetical protein Pan153_39890 [Gimesia panareensis]|uniref:Uncharacterized protein n=1 Tax=Gimesia panareensis TaxID=2527978 RepID=A0A518FSK8_9PLAN|nr:hypothetical protein [Gimesia panareensis]QDV19324.1 hypothetical protein Pan153_39890 [Gimesia panareensis]
MRYWIPTIILLQIVMCNGCSSIKTTAYDRLEDDTLVANPDQHLKGVPVSLRVPTHLELTVEEKTFWRAEGTELIPVTSCRSTRTVSHKVQCTEKIFLVDPVRPGGGPTGANDISNSYGFSFKNDDITADDISKDIRERDYQYSGKGQLTGIHYHIQDETILRSAELLAASLKFIENFPTKGKLSGYGEGNKNIQGLNLIQTTRVIAWSRFDLNSEHFEDDVMDFLNTYVNQKHIEQASFENQGR